MFQRDADVKPAVQSPPQAPFQIMTDSWQNQFESAGYGVIARGQQGWHSPSVASYQVQQHPGSVTLHYASASPACITDRPLTGQRP